jgi:hypothetical protein
MGMEMPWVLFFLAASWLAYLRRRHALAGMLLGGLLLVRPDMLVWVIVLVGAATFRSRKEGVKILLLASATYLPWLLFAWLSFGSPIPMTITAKYWAHFIQGKSIQASQIEPLIATLISRLQPLGVLAWRTNPFAIRDLSHPLNPLTTLLVTILAALGAIRLLKMRELLPQLVFLIVELFRLTLFKQLFIDRYFIAAIWSSSLIIGLGVGTLLDQLPKNRIVAVTKGVSATGFLALVVITTIANARDLYILQNYRNEASLKRIGIWLHEYRESSSTVLLEPLGYIGYYSKLHMLDEVGIVTPEVVELKKQGISRPAEMVAALSPDAFVIHCDDMERLKSESIWIQQGMNKKYDFVYRSDPLNFLTDLGLNRTSSVLARSACYEVWIQ